MITTILCALTLVLGDGPPADAARPDDALIRQFDRVEDALREMGDWSAQSELMRTSMHKVFERNGWDGEPHQFALKLIDEVNRIPPWEFPDRMNTAMKLVEERYRLTPEQRSRLEALALQESTTFYLKHARVILDQTRDWAAARGRGEPFTPEQIARWAQSGEPLMVDMRKRVESAVKRLADDFTPEQRETLERDFSGFRERMSLLEEMRGEWAAGRWRPEQWGMEADPIQTGAGLPGSADAPVDPSSAAATDGGHGAAAARRPSPTRVLPYDETTWRVYVQRTSDRFRFDAAQRLAADSILGELVGRASDYRRDRAEQIAQVPAAARAYDPLLAPVRAWYEQLIARVEALPTGTQRLLSGF